MRSSYLVHRYGIGLVSVSLMVVTVGYLSLGSFARGNPTADFWLVTPEEAAMANAEGPPTLRKRGIDPRSGPVIELLKPAAGQASRAPVEIDVKFRASAAPIDESTIQVTLLKIINVDLTDRLRPYMSASGIYIPNANLPSGRHAVRIKLADRQGNASSSQMTLQIE
jgi:hypothetical protein